MADKFQTNIKDQTPVFLVRDVVSFPHSLTPITVEGESNLAALAAAMNEQRLLALFPEMPSDEELAKLPDATSFQVFNLDGVRHSAVGILLRVIKELKFPDGSMRILVRGVNRIINSGIDTKQSVPRVIPEILSNADTPEDEMGNLPRQETLLMMFQELVKLHPGLPDELQLAAINASSPAHLADLLSDALPLPYPEKILLLTRSSVKERLNALTLFINRELEILKVSMKLQAEVNHAMGQSQREFYLREQLRSIQKELKEDSRSPDVIELEKKRDAMTLPPNVLEVVNREMSRLELLPQAAPEYHIAYTYINWLLDVPWLVQTEDCLDCEAAAKILDKDHYALKDVKERILDFLAVLQLRGKESLKAPILCLVGPPGVGKTSLGKSIARAMNRNFIRFSLGGLRDEAEIRGHRRTYVGAMPGRIIQNLKKAKSANPVFMLDEIDKLAHDFRGDPASALLEVLDPAQNNAFNDNYLEVDCDLSKVFFIATANLSDSIPAPLLDRMEVVRLPGYTAMEKREIAMRYLVPRQLENAGLKPLKFKISIAAVNEIIDYYTREAGVRELERTIEQLCRKMARKVTEKAELKKTVNASMVREMLGPRKYLIDEAEMLPTVGCATGMAWTSCGGVILPIEVLAIPGGKGNLKLTGSLGKVMQESAETAFSLIRSRAAQWGIKPEYFSEHDFHIHVPDGATPKDGPSAGVTLAVALKSLICKIPPRKQFAMTGEITLSGRVTAIGGVREKVIAALRAGIKVVMLPEENRKDITEIPEEVRSELKIHFVKNFEQAEQIAFE